LKRENTGQDTCSNENNVKDNVALENKTPTVTIVIAHINSPQAGPKKPLLNYH